MPRPRTRPGSFAPIRGVVVVVPVHNEEAHLDHCLAAIHASFDHPAVRGLRTCLVVALDDCRDASATIAARWGRASDVTVVLTARSVGAARATGVAAGLRSLDLEPEAVWLAHTDADSIVPRHWLARHLVRAGGADAVAGVVRVPDWSPHDRATRQAFDRHYRSSILRPHPHVHGANLGVRASSYLAVGGFPPVRCSEDHALWEALRLAGHRMRSSRQVWVSTSARRAGRAVGGFADTLMGLAAGADPGVTSIVEPVRLGTDS